MKFAIFIAVLFCIQGVAFARKFSGNVTRTSNSTRDKSSKFFYLGTKYGNFCGAGNSQWGKNAIDDIDACCYWHDLCFTSNCSDDPGQCECNDDLWSCAAAISRKCGLSWSKKCRYTRNVVTYAAGATACTC